MDEIEKITENHRFRVAMAIIIGFLLIFLVALVGEILGVYQGVTNLAAIFSSWLTAVIGFYFLGQSAAQARQQTREIAREAANVREEKSRVEKEKLGIIHKGRPQIEELEDIIEGYKSLTEELITKFEEMGKGVEKSEGDK